MDTVSPEVRSRIMSAIRGRDTTPERVVRSALHRMGYRFRVHVRDLSGSPDVVLPRHRAVIFVHGCFWHRHRCRAGRAEPRTNAAFWREKRRRNQERDRRAVRALRRQGWRVLVLWECQIRDAARLASSLADYLGEKPVPVTSTARRRASPGRAPRTPREEPRRAGRSGRPERPRASRPAKAGRGARASGRSRSSP